MAEILSQEEIDALLSAVSYGEEVEVETEPSKTERLVNTYDFRHPARVSKDQLRTLQNLHDNFARLLSSTFSHPPEVHYRDQPRFGGSDNLQ